eukprot:COSAG05_NODE_1079_length_5951_cov_17.759911_5_plen_54_part_00
MKRTLRQAVAASAVNIMYCRRRELSSSVIAWLDEPSHAQIYLAVVCCRRCHCP